MTSSSNFFTIHFVNKGLEFIHLNSILREDDMIMLMIMSESLLEDKIPLTVFSLSNIIRNKSFNYKDIVNSINTTNDTSTYGIV